LCAHIVSDYILDCTKYAEHVLASD